MRAGYTIENCTSWTYSMIICMNYNTINVVQFLYTSNISIYSQDEIVAVFKLKKLNNEPKIHDQEHTT